jgi:hypothetical protein
MKAWNRVGLFAQLGIIIEAVVEQSKKGSYIMFACNFEIVVNASFESVSILLP